MPQRQVDNILFPTGQVYLIVLRYRQNSALQLFIVGNSNVSGNTAVFISRYISGNNAVFISRYISGNTSVIMGRYISGNRHFIRKLVSHYTKTQQIILSLPSLSIWTLLNYMNGIKMYGCSKHVIKGMKLLSSRMCFTQ